MIQVIHVGHAIIYIYKHDNLQHEKFQNVHM